MRKGESLIAIAFRTLEGGEGSNTAPVETLSAECLNTVCDFMSELALIHEGAVRICAHILQADTEFGPRPHGVPETSRLIRFFAPQAVVLYDGRITQGHAFFSQPLEGERYDVFQVAIRVCVALALDVKCPKPFTIISNLLFPGFEIRVRSLASAFCSATVTRMQSLRQVSGSALSNSAFYRCEPIEVMDGSVFLACSLLPKADLEDIVKRCLNEMTIIMGDVARCTQLQNDISKLKMTVALQNSVLLAMQEVTKNRRNASSLSSRQEVEREAARLVLCALLNAGAALVCYSALMNARHTHLHTALRRLLATAEYSPPGEAAPVTICSEIPLVSLSLDEARRSLAQLWLRAICDANDTRMSANACRECCGLMVEITFRFGHPGKNLRDELISSEGKIDPERRKQCETIWTQLFDSQGVSHQDWIALGIVWVQFQDKHQSR